MVDCPSPRTHETSSRDAVGACEPKANGFGRAEPQSLRTVTETGAAQRSDRRCTRALRPGAAAGDRAPRRTRQPLRLRTRRRVTATVILLGLIFLAPLERAVAHVPVYGVGTASQYVFTRDAVRVTFDLSYSVFWAQAEMIGMDVNKDSYVDQAEADRYLQKQWDVKIRDTISASLDGTPLPIRKISQKHDALVGEVYESTFSLYYELELAFPSRVRPNDTHRFQFVDGVVGSETPGKPIYYVPFEGHEAGDDESLRLRPTFVEPPDDPQLVDFSYRLEGERLTIDFSFVPVSTVTRVETLIGGGNTPRDDPPNSLGAVAAAVSATGRAAPSNAATVSSEGTLAQVARRARSLSWASTVGWLLLAAAFGIAHAMLPGHGKSLVAAYLVGSRGRIRDAVTIGIVTAATHTFSVFVFALGISLIVDAGTRLSEGALHNMVMVVTQLSSGLLLVGLGTILTVRHLRRRIQEPTAQPPLEDHGVPPAASRPRIWELLTLGFSGGLVPCPAAIALIPIGLEYPDSLPFTLGLLVFFSLGLSAVLVAIGLLLVSGRAITYPRLQAGFFFRDLDILKRRFSASFLERLDLGGRRWVRMLPIASSLFIIGVGAYFVVTTYLNNETQVTTWMRFWKSWWS